MAGVIHNAMQFARAPFLSLRPEDFESVWKSIVLTAVNTSHQAVPRLIARGGGSLIFSGASGSRRAGAQFSAFSSAKFALRGLCQSLAREHGTDGVHVAHVVIDGLIDSDRTRERFGDADGTPRIAAAALAELYWQLFHQPANAWTHEIDVRPADIAP